MTLPQLNRKPAPVWMRKRLSNWLSEWRLEQQLAAPPEAETETGSLLREGEAGICGTPGPRSTQSPAPPCEGQPAPAVGQLRLLAPDLLPADSRPLFVAILAQPGRDAFLVAPYGRFAEPATDGELLTRRTTPALRVLCLWNTALLPAGRLARSWLADTLSERERAEARAVQHHVATAAGLPRAVRRRVGPPLLHPRDPRHAYCREEAVLMDAASTDETEAVEGPASWNESAGGYALAAETAAPYDI